MKRQSGFTTFTITLLLVLILLGISLLVGKMLVADRRVTLNEVLYRQAMAMAEVGLADGLGRLALDPTWRTSGATTTLTTGSYTLSSVDDAAITVGAVAVTPRHSAFPGDVKQ
ncbi:PilX N-terminal domain-containing pilus assembly protein [Aeromonas veronii]|uniref:PilX N-terminal domain-containing pilus assembly protein n=1 Tax=Aeromonas veronii TaxID=654 RepID=UPI00244379D9|nr:PilX N-terminal domain-containing pilus assembly protein [Aeromonas veronii]